MFDISHIMNVNTKVFGGQKYIALVSYMKDISM